MQANLPLSITVAELPTENEKAFSNAWDSLCANLDRTWTDLVVLPELPFHSWMFAQPEFDDTVWREACKDHERKIDLLFSHLAAQSTNPNLYIASTRPVQVGDERFNMGFIWSANSGLQDVHSKALLPNEDGVWEANWYHSGPRDVDVFSLEIADKPIKIGFQICTELWFTDISRALAHEGVDIILAPRATGRSTLPKWNIAVQAASIMSGAFVATSNRSTPGKDDFGGGSMISSPDGVILGQTTADCPILTHIIDINTARKAKSTYPRNISGF